MLVSVLCNNRNLHSQFDAAWTVGVLTRGRMCLSGSTYMRIGYGRTSLRPHWVVGFATTLGVPAGDLAAITCIELPDEPLRDDLVASRTAGLIWNLRRLSGAQARQVLDEAKAMLVAVPDDASDREWNRVYHQHGVWRAHYALTWEGLSARRVAAGRPGRVARPARVRRAAAARRRRRLD